MRRLLFAAAGALLFAGMAEAADCGDPGSTAAALLPPEAVSAEGFFVSALLGLEPETFPSDDIRRQAAPCRRLEFKLGDEAWSLYGGADTTPPRWATSTARPGKVVFLAAMPWPEDALRWADARKRNPETEATFERLALALTIAEGDKRAVYALYDAAPDDARLVRHMAAALTGELQPFAVYDVRTNRLD